MDKIHILELIHRYEGKSVHITTVDGGFYTGLLQIEMAPDFSRRKLLIGTKEVEVNPQDVSEIRAV